MKFLTFLFVASSLFAADAPKLKPLPLKPPGTTQQLAPVIPPEEEIKYWRAVVDSTAAQQVAKETQAALQGITSRLLEKCGEKHQLQNQVDAQGKPVGRMVCSPKSGK